MRKTYDLKQVKISTSILWLLNKAETRTVFFSSMDIFSNKAKLHLHSLIIRGLISGELYCAVLSKLFPSNDKPIKTKDFQSIIDFIIQLDKNQLAEVAVLQQKNRDNFIENLTNQDPFELSEHLQIIDAIMCLHLWSSELIFSIPSIIGKLCNFRPTNKEPKKLLEIWFKCMTCLALSENNIKDTQQLIKAIITQDSTESNDKMYLDSIKFSDKIALIMHYESNVLETDNNFIFDFSVDGSASRDNVKNNFISVIHIFRKHFQKVLEDFKELMLMLNSSQIQLSNNLLINIDLFVLEFFTQMEQLSNHGNRTFRTGSNNSEIKTTTSSQTFRIENPTSNINKKGVYHTVNKPAQLDDKYSKFGAFGTYSGRKPPPMDYHNSTYEEKSSNWMSNKTGSNLLQSNRKSSVPNGLNFTGVNKSISSNLLLSDGTLKSSFLTKKKGESFNNDGVDMSQTSWILQADNTDKSNQSNTRDALSDQENEGPRLKINETRLRLNMKRQEIEGNRRQLHQQLAKERQLLSDKVFKDVTMGISQSEEDENINYRPRRVSDMKRNRGQQHKVDLVRSRSQDLSKASADDISVSLNQLKSEISKLTSEQARLSAKIAENKLDSVDAFSPRLNQSTMSREDGYDNRSNERSSIRSMPISWHPYNNYGNDETYINYPPQYPYPMEHKQKFYPPPYIHYPSYTYGYPSEVTPYQLPPPMNSITSHHIAKSLHDNVNSRPGSPGAISEPSKTREVLSEKSLEIQDTKPLTIQNLIKHNKSMEQLPNDTTHSDINSQKSLTQNSKEMKVMDFSPNSIKQSSVHSSLHQIPSDVVVKTKHVVNESELPTRILLDNTNNHINGDKEINGNSKIEDSKIAESPQLFFVSFDDEKPIKKIPKKPKIKEDININYDKPQNVVNDKKSIPENSEYKLISKNVEKPLAFVIKVSDDKSSDPNIDMSKDKLFYLTEKREQERKEKLEKIREVARIENEKRLQRELEKDKIKQEKRQKRDAIFEAHLEKKLEKESDERQPRKDARSNKRPNRAISAAPFLQRNEFVIENLTDQSFPVDNISPDLPSFGSRRDKLPIALPGTKLFVEPKIKSNKNVILNAIKYCCLAGKVNESVKQQTIEELDRFDASHFMILMRGGCQYRSLYRFEVDSECLTKLTGVGPKRITNKMVDKFFKYNSGSKKFIEITSTNHLSTVIDGVTIFNTLWKTVNVLSNQVNSSETSSQAEHTSQ